MTEPNAYDDTDLLNYAIQTGIISLDTMLNDIADMERKEILAQHVYAITVTTDKSGKEIYSTYLAEIQFAVYPFIENIININFFL